MADEQVKTVISADIQVKTDAAKAELERVAAAFARAFSPKGINTNALRSAITDLEKMVSGPMAKAGEGFAQSLSRDLSRVVRQIRSAGGEITEAQQREVARLSEIAGRARVRQVATVSVTEDIEGQARAAAAEARIADAVSRRAALEARAAETSEAASRRRKKAAAELSLLEAKAAAQAAAGEAKIADAASRRAVLDARATAISEVASGRRETAAAQVSLLEAKAAATSETASRRRETAAAQASLLEAKAAATSEAVSRQRETTAARVSLLEAKTANEIARGQQAAERAAQRRQRGLERIAQLEAEISGITSRAAATRLDPSSGLSPLQESRGSIANIRATQNRMRDMSGNPFQVLAAVSGSFTGITPIRREIEDLSGKIVESAQRAEAAARSYNSLERALRQIKRAGGAVTPDQIAALRSLKRDADSARQEIDKLDARARKLTTGVGGAGFKGRAAIDFLTQNILVGSLFTVGFTAAQAINENIVAGAVTFGRKLLDPIAIAKDKAAELKQVLGGVAEDPERVAAAIGISLREARGFRQAFAIGENLQLQTEFRRRVGPATTPEMVIFNDIKKFLNVDEQRAISEKTGRASTVMLQAATIFAAAVAAQRLGAFIRPSAGAGAAAGTAVNSAGRIYNTATGRFVSGGAAAVGATEAAAIGATTRAAAAANKAATAISSGPLAKASGAIAKIGGSNVFTAGVSAAITIASGGGAGEAAGTFGGSIAGTAIGATIGTFLLPGIGTAIGGFIGGIAGSIGGGAIGSNLDRANGQGTNAILPAGATAAVVASVARVSIAKIGVGAAVIGTLLQSPDVQSFVSENIAAIQSGDPGATAQIGDVARNAIAVQRLDIARSILSTDTASTKLTVDQIAFIGTLKGIEAEIGRIKERQMEMEQRRVDIANRALTAASDELARQRNLVDILRAAAFGGPGGNVDPAAGIEDPNRAAMARIARERMNIDRAQRNEQLRQRNIDREERLQRIRDAISIAGVRQAGMTSFDVAANIAEAQAQQVKEQRGMAAEERANRRSDRLYEISLQEQYYTAVIAAEEAVIARDNASAAADEAKVDQGAALSEALIGGAKEARNIWDTVTSAGYVARNTIDGFASLLEAVTGIQITTDAEMQAAQNAFRAGERGRAIGGPVTGGSAYMVGERGPEIFVPGTSGRIAPNAELGRGGSTTIVLQAAPVMIDGQRVGEVIERRVSVNNSRRAAFGVG
jgi:hypothetical protein